jgi:transcriptional regulator with XRE-family HTH domain
MNNCLNTARLINSRRIARLSQKEVAHKLDMSLQEYRDIEKGETTLAPMLVVYLATVIGVTPSYLRGKS